MRSFREQAGLISIPLRFVLWRAVVDEALFAEEYSSPLCLFKCPAALVPEFFGYGGQGGGKGRRWQASQCTQFETPIIASCSAS